jgi:thiamine biosynthesis lipoprotein
MSQADEGARSAPSSIPIVVRHARQAMATRFEIALHGPDAVNLRAVAEEALAEVERLEAQLSFYRPESELSDLNARAAGEWVVLDPRFFALLQHAAELSRHTGGAFDPTVAPLVRCWGFADGAGRVPAEQEIEEARQQVGSDQIEFDEEAFAVRFRRPGVTIDLGAIGKGYAIDRAVAILREQAVSAALLHGGTSSVFGLGSPPESPEGWKIGLRHPTRPDERLTTVVLRDRALGVSAPHGKFFQSEGERYGHVINPRSGRPVRAALLAAVVTDSATEADALSTALLTLGESGLEFIGRRWPDAAALVALESGDGEARVASLAWG